MFRGEVTGGGEGGGGWIKATVSTPCRPKKMLSS